MEKRIYSAFKFFLCFAFILSIYLSNTYAELSPSGLVFYVTDYCHDSKTGAGLVHFVCDIPDQDGNNLIYIWNFGDGTTIRTNKKDVYHHFNKLDFYKVRCTVEDLNGRSISKEINFNLAEFLANLYAPVLYFSKSDANQVYETYFPTSIDNFINHMVGLCLDESYIEEVKGDIQKQEPLTIYYKIFENSQEIVLEYWFFYLYNDFPFNYHQGDWEGVAFILDKDTWDIKKGIFYHHYDADTIDGKQIEYLNSHPKVFVTLGNHASYSNSGISPIFDVHIGNYINMCVDSNFNGCNYEYKLVNMENIVNILRDISVWGCNDSITPLGKSPKSPLFQGEKYFDPEVWVAKLEKEFPKPVIKDFRFSREGDSLILELTVKNEGTEGVGYLVINFRNSELNCGEIIILNTDSNVKCSCLGEKLNCSRSKEKNYELKCPHIEAVISPMKQDEEYTLKIMIAKTEQNIIFLDLKFIMSDQKQDHWVYAEIDNSSLPFCLFIDQENELAWRTFVLTNGDMDEYLASAYICHDVAYIPCIKVDDDLLLNRVVFDLSGGYIRLINYNIVSKNSLKLLEVEYKLPLDILCSQYQDGKLIIPRLVYDKKYELELEIKLKNGEIYADVINIKPVN